MGDLPIPLGKHRELNSCVTFDGLYVNKHLNHPVDGAIKGGNYHTTEHIKNVEMEARREIEESFSTGRMFGNHISNCTCINSRGQLVKSGLRGLSVPCDHPCCLAPYLITYTMTASSRFCGNDLIKAPTTSTSSEPTPGEEWDGYSDVSPELIKVLQSTWRE